MISIQLRQALLNLMWEGGYQVLDAGEPVQRATFDAMQKLVRNEPLAGEPPIPQPPAEPLARIMAAPSQWAKWCDQTSAESEYLIANGFLTRDQKNFLNNWWRDNGVRGQRLPDGRYQYATYQGGMETLHIDTGGADAATEAACGKPIPGPALP